VACDSIHDRNTYAAQNILAAAHRRPSAGILSLWDGVNVKLALPVISSPSIDRSRANPIAAPIFPHSLIQHKLSVFLVRIMTLTLLGEAGRRIAACKLWEVGVEMLAWVIG
jgi:hypothetical protein